MGWSAPNLPPEPHSRELPIAQDGIARHAESFGGLFNGQSAKVPHFDDVTLARIDRLQRREGIVKGHQVVLRLSRCGLTFDERDAADAAAALLILPAPRGVHEHAAHQPRGHREKVRAIRPPDALQVDQPQIRLIDQSSRLQAMTGTLPGHVLPRELAQFLVHQRNELIEGICFAPAPGEQQPGQVLGGCHPGIVGPFPADATFYYPIPPLAARRRK